MKKESIDWRIIIVALVCLTIINVAGMYYGINGGLRTLIVAIIAALCGVAIPSQIIKKT